MVHSISGRCLRVIVVCFLAIGLAHSAPSSAQGLRARSHTSQPVNRYPAARPASIVQPRESPFYDVPGLTYSNANGAVGDVKTPAVIPTQYIGGPSSSTIAADSPAPPAWQPSTVAPPPNSWKPGWLKGGQVTGSYVPSTDGDEFGFLGLDTRVTFQTPAKPLTITPRFGILWTEGPLTTATEPAEVPGQLFDASVEARWFQPLNENWVLDVAVAPGLYTDGQNTSSDSLRITGRALAFYKWSDAVRIGFGAVYLDRDDVNVLPAAGLLIFPSYDTKLELVFPRPRLAHRIQTCDTFDRWAYVAGEFGGGQWAIERAVAGTEDILSYRDYRFLAGIEHKGRDGTGWLVEGGFLFGREFEYESGLGDRELDSTAIVRVGATF